MAAPPLPPSVESASGKKFYFQGHKLLLTYADIHLDKDAFTEWIEACVGFEPKFIRIAHETGLSTGVPFKHSHVLMDFGKRFQSRDCRRFDWNSGNGILHPNWRPVKSMSHWQNCTQYLAKEDPENQDLLVRSCVGRVWDAPSLQDALLDVCSDPGQAPGVIALWNARPSREIDVALPDRPWQQAVLELIRSKPHPRAVHWFFDPVGDTGKTWLSRYLMANKLAYSVKQCAGSYHFATIVQGAIASGWDQRCFVFDLPRSMEDLSFYGPLEEVKDGHVTAVKYQGGSLVFNQPHVLVFANFLPRRDKLSRDRWRVHEILSDLSLKPPLGPFGGDSVASPSGSATESEALTLFDNRPPPPPPCLAPSAPRADNILWARDERDFTALFEEVLADLPSGHALSGLLPKKSEGD